ncbi:MAG TPA: thiamine phosphate synthase [Candidatus Brocadiia bacterium]|nr:thiamine phosphate synthase [Candidatus Brocadiia bacterium]
MWPAHRDVILITDSAASALPIEDAIDASLRGGIRAVQLREKNLDGKSLLELAHRARGMTKERGASLIINSRIDVAMAVGADGVHLGARSISIVDARRIVGSEILIGYSAHSPQEARDAAEAGADYVFISPIYPTRKPYDVKPLGAAAVKETARLARIPVYALGGVNESNAAEVMAAGATGVAVISAILSSDDPESASRELLRAIRAAHRRS